MVRQASGKIELKNFNPQIASIPQPYFQDIRERNIAISKNVVRENDECQLSNGDCATEKKCGY